MEVPGLGGSGRDLLFLRDGKQTGNEQESHRGPAGSGCAPGMGGCRRLSPPHRPLVLRAVEPEGKVQAIGISKCFSNRNIR